MTHAVGPAVAGRWYPSDPAELADLVDRLLEEANETATGTEASTPALVIAPHAGFEYSGRVAAQAFRALARNAVAPRVLLIGPSHYVSFRGARVPPAAAYRTPLGDVAIDRDTVENLVAQPGFAADDRLWAKEHSLEAELPFLQRTLGGRFAVVPVVVGASSAGGDLRAVAAGLTRVVDDVTLIVVSSDFTHYGRAFDYVPFDDDVPDEVRELDRGAIDFIIAADADGFARYCGETGATICGRLAIELALRLPLGKLGGRLLAYDTSGRMTGDWSHSVSYAAIALTREEPA